MPTAATLTEVLAPLRADPRRAAVLLDVDGTLAPIVRHADEARVPERTRRVLAEIARRYRLVACVSGRRASDARRIVSIGSLLYVGSHGSELLRAGATAPVVDPALEEWRPRVQAFARRADTPELRRLRVRLEDKGAIAAFHWRGAPDEEAARATIEALARRAEIAGLRTHWGRTVLEIRPPVRIDKGAGIAVLLDEADVDAALYAGDDTTDVDAFRALDELTQSGRLRSAIRVGVRSDEGPPAIVEEADLVVEGTEGVVAVLEALL